MTSSNGNIFCVTGLLCGKFTGDRWFPRTKVSDAELGYFFDLHLNKRLIKQWWSWWFETPSRPSWRHCNAWILMKSGIQPQKTNYNKTMCINHLTECNRGGTALVFGQSQLSLPLKPQVLWHHMASLGNTELLTHLHCGKVSTNSYSKRF